ncbi:MAG: hypothetical protein QMD25_03090 [Caldisericia bacterium]|jgi:hypothetical protein|nr:hypothetical protein [Caldisericia bacterium]
MDEKVQRITEIGHGGEATVYLELRRSFPFFEKNFYTKRDFLTSYRVLHKGDIISKELLFKKSFSEFLRHLIAKKLDDYFLRKELYKFPHIPRLLGFDTFGYYYEFVWGLEGYYPLYFDEELFTYLPVKLLDEDEARRCFHEAGIYIFQDIVEPTSNYVKNLIIEEPEISILPNVISNLWKRIDFGVKSIKFDYFKINDYFKRNKKDLIKFLGKKRFSLINLANLYLILNGDEKKFNQKNFNKLKKLIEPFLKSTLDHMEVIEEVPTKFGKRFKEIRGKVLKVKKIKEKKSFEKKEFYSKIIFEEADIKFNLSITNRLKSFDGIIETKHVVPLGKVIFENKEKGIKTFLLNFLIKKFEDFFITLEYYTFPHIPRPFGAFENIFIFEYPFGKRILKENFINSFLVEDLKVFYEKFLEIGIDLLKKENFYIKNNERFSKNIFILQPPHTVLEKVSRMWTYCIFSFDQIEIDYNKLYDYLIKNERVLRKNLKKGRYETMILSIKYLLEGLNKKEFRKLKEGILNFRISSLRHYSPYEVIILKEEL